MGSKARLAKHILPIMLKDRKDGQYWVEPFVGACNLIDKVDGNRIGSDVNPYIIALYKALQNGWVPPSIVSKEEYITIKENKEFYPAELVAFVGYGCSFGGKWFNGYAACAKGINYADQSKRSVLKQLESMMNVDLRVCNYYELQIPPNSIIYCDPPYASTTDYKAVDTFDSQAFFEWCREKRKEGHTVFVSEYQASDDFTCVFEKTVSNPLSDKNRKAARTEKLFKLI